MLIIDITENKQSMAEVVHKVTLGEDIIIQEYGRPIARLTPIHDDNNIRPLGLAKGKISVSSDFDEPLSPELLNEFYK